MFLVAKRNACTYSIHLCIYRYACTYSMHWYATPCTTWSACIFPKLFHILLHILHPLPKVCLGVRAMHAFATPYAHRDIKPHNILLNPRAGSNGRGAARDDEASPLTSAANGTAGTGARFAAVLMDFGSAKPAHVVVMNRNAALAVQEEAEACGMDGVGSSTYVLLGNELLLQQTINTPTYTGSVHCGVSCARTI